MSRLIDTKDLLDCQCKNNFSECDTCLDSDLCDLLHSIPTVHAIPVEKVKAAREEISKASRDFYEELAQTFYNDAIKDAVAILDKLIAESEE